MKKLSFRKNTKKLSLLVFTLVLGFAGSTMAATTPDLGIASGFAVLSETFTNTVAGTILNGHLGYITAPAMAPTVNGTTYIGVSATMTSATSGQDAALADLNAQVLASCTDIGVSLLNAYTTGGNPAGTFSPGCYSSAGAMTTAVGPVTITLSGAGTYIFRPGTTLDTLANVSIVLTGGASACDVFWAPLGATTIGANNNFIGTVIGSPAITVGDVVSWTGRALNNGASKSVTFSNGNATLTVPTCPVPPGTGTLNVIKTIINLGGGTAVASDFIMNVNTSTGVFVASGVGTGGSGTAYLLSSGVYTVSETANSTYTTTYTHALLLNCANISISSGGSEICTVLNTYIIPPVVPSGGGGSTLLIDVCLSGDYSTSYYDGICGIAPVVHAAPLSQAINVVKVANRITPFPYGGGDVIYTYVVTNPSDSAIHNVSVTDDKCSPLMLAGGDTNRDHLLDVTEIRTYTCSTHVSVSTRNVVTVIGDANGVAVSDTDFANVVVVPGLPRTGLTTSTQWDIIIFAGVVLIVFSILFVVIRKRKI